MKSILVMTRMVSLVALVSLAGCADMPNSANVYQGSQTQGEQSIRMGVVESVRNVKIDKSNGSDMGLGTIGGAALGGVAGSAIGGGRGSIAGAVGGAIAGGMIGNYAEKNMKTKAGLEITVKLDSGKWVAVTQDADEAFYVGDRVRLLSDGRTTRVTH